MYRTQKNHIRTNKKNFKILKLLTHLSKNIYNYTLYTVKKYYEDNASYLQFKHAYHLVKHNENFKLIPTGVGVETLKIVDRNMKSFFHVLRERKKGNYNRPVNLPRYLPKNGYFVCVFPRNYFKIINDKIRLTLGRTITKEYNVRFLWFTIPKNINKNTIKEIRIIPRYKAKYFEIEYVYEVEQVKGVLNDKNYLAIDLGVDNFATCVTTSGTPFIIEGRGLKSFNRWYNKEKAKLQSIYSKQKIKYGNKSMWLNFKRHNFLNNFMNQSVNLLIKYCLKHKIKTIIIGELKEIKRGINLGKRNNQNFCYIPYGMFKFKLKSKSEYYGIDYVEVNEAYTSQTCSNCGIVKKSNRKYRGLYVCKNCGEVINADVNGALNILKKVAGESSVKKILSSGLVGRPMRIRAIPIAKLLIKSYSP